MCARGEYGSSVDCLFRWCVVCTWPTMLAHMRNPTGTLLFTLLPPRVHGRSPGVRIHPHSRPLRGGGHVRLLSSESDPRNVIQLRWRDPRGKLAPGCPLVRIPTARHCRVWGPQRSGTFGAKTEVHSGTFGYIRVHSGTFGHTYLAPGLPTGL